MNQSAEKIRESVKEHYAKAASADSGCCAPGCCGGSESSEAETISSELGYSAVEMDAVPEGANLGLGCGNPQAIANLKVGETVLDLGSGAGFDSFLAAAQVGSTGKVIGVDMTPAMLEKARQNAATGGFGHVEFRQGFIEALPVEDDTIDVILSNCVINLSPEKEKVFAEAYRVLRPGGRLAISDVVRTAEFPEALLGDLDLISACVTGSETIGEIERILRAVGFKNIRIEPKDQSQKFIKEWSSNVGVEDYIQSATIEAVK